MSDFLPARPRLVAERFRVGDELGRGRTGVVYAGRDESTGRDVAMKQLHRHLVEDTAVRAALEHDAGVAARLAHPQILPVLGIWRDEDDTWLITRRVEGPSLEAGCASGFPVAAALSLAEDVARALEAAHAADIVHGDVRPGNVLIGRSGAILFDFGHAAARRLDPDAAVLPGVSAPETTAGHPATPLTDVYGLGVVLHYALTGRAPWTGSSAWAVLAAQRAGPPRLHALPTGVASLLSALLHPDPLRRPGDMRAVRRAIAALREAPFRAPRLSSPIAPFRRGGWAVSGIDPATRAPALIAEGLGRRRANALARRLRAAGWRARAHRVGLGPGDLATAAVIAAAGAVIIPVVGGFIAPYAYLRWQSRRARPSIVEMLPRTRAPLPPIRLMPGSEYLVVIAGLAAVTAVTALLTVWLALVPAAAMIAMIGAYGRAIASDANLRARRARADLAFAEARRLLSAPTPALDATLALHGELDGVERDWRAGRRSDDDTVDRAEALLDRIRKILGVNAEPRHTDPVASALRRGDDLT
jgi:hypothetical protein